MAIKNVAFNIRADGSETVNNQAALIAAAVAANAVAGAKADITAELTAISANQPTGAVVVSYDTSLVTTKNQLRRLLDAAYRHFAEAQNTLT